MGIVWFYRSIEVLTAELVPLMPEGMTCQAFSSLEEMSDFLLRESSQLPDLLIIDFRQNASGQALLAAIRQMPALSTLPIVGVIDKPEQRDLLFVCGANDYLFYPFTQAEVYTRLQNLCDLREISSLHQQAQSNAAKFAFVVLLSRLLSHRLDLNQILAQTLEQSMTLMQAESGVIWLVSENGEWLTPASSASQSFSKRLFHRRPFNQGLIGWVAFQRETLYITHPESDYRTDPYLDKYNDALQYALLAVPLTHQEQLIGVLAVYTRKNFEREDAVFLNNIAPVAASAISNARFYNRALGLVRQHKQQYQQVLQKERMVIMGRLTASLSHEINNPMQAIQGALSLALEELENPQELTHYIELCQQESARVVKLVNRLRRIYYNQTEKPEMFDVNLLLIEVITIAKKQLDRQNLELSTHLEKDLPLFRGIISQIQLAFLDVLFYLCDAIEAAGGKDIQIHTERRERAVCIQFIHPGKLPLNSLPPVPLSPNGLAQFNDLPDLFAITSDFNLLPVRNIVSEHNGSFNVVLGEDLTTLIIELPVGNRSA